MAEIRRIAVRSQPGQIVLETLSQKNPPWKRVDEVGQGVGPEFKPKYCKTRKMNKETIWESNRRPGRQLLCLQISHFLFATLFIMQL
jgi:hypothetical protein